MSSTESSVPVCDVSLAELEDDPYPAYARMRQAQPVAFLPAIGQWAVARWDDCDRLGRDAELVGPVLTVLEEFFGPNVLTAEGERHKDLRAGVDPPLRPRAVGGYIEDRARPVARAAVARLRDRGRADASAELLERISVRVIGDVIGLSDVSEATLQGWFHALGGGGGADLTGGETERERAATVKAEIDDYMRDAVDRLTRRPDESGLSHMVHSGTEDGRTRTFDELIGTIRVLCLGGLQEPGHGATASLLGLLSDPEQAAAIQADPAGLAGPAVHEGLRWLSPFGSAGRRALRDIELHGTVIPAGDDVHLLCASANRDEARYDHPERFDLHRPRQGHAAFGYGAHFCAGHFISRRLEEIMLEEVFLGLPNLRLDPERDPVVRGFFARGVKTLPVVWDVDGADTDTSTT